MTQPKDPNRLDFQGQTTFQSRINDVGLFSKAIPFRNKKITNDRFIFSLKYNVNFCFDSLIQSSAMIIYHFTISDCVELSPGTRSIFDFANVSGLHPSRRLYAENFLNNHHKNWVSFPIPLLASQIRYILFF